MLCVQYDNSNSQRKFYKDPNLLSASTVDKELAQTELGYSQWKASLPVIVDRYYDSGDSIGAVFSSIEADSALVSACCAVNAFPGYIINHNLLSRWQLLPGVYHCQRTHNSESTSSLGTKQINKAT